MRGARRPLADDEDATGNGTTTGWYPDVPAVLDTNQLAELLHTNQQIIPAWVREGIILCSDPTTFLHPDTYLLKVRADEPGTYTIEVNVE